MSALQTVHVRVNDAATGQPTPVRIRFTGPDGTYYAPFGRLTEFATGPNVDVGGNLDVSPFQATCKYCYIDGTCEIRLPVGAIKVEVHKGPEYAPLFQEIQLTPGKLALRLAVQRWIDLRYEHWYSGDIRAHYLTPHAAVLEGAAEGLAVVNLLARVTFVHDLDAWSEVTPRTPCAIPNLLSFSGQRPAVEMSDCMVVVNTLNWHARLGALGLLNCHRVVYPLIIGRPWGDDDWTLADWCDQCHRKRGLVIWVQTDFHFSGGNYGETLADLILGKVDAVEVVRLWPAFSEGRKFDWYGLLNCGFRVPLVGGSEKDANNIPLGAVRTYVRLQSDQVFDYGTWIEGIRAGRTFVTNGPLLSFTVNGNDPGAVLTGTPEGLMQVHAECRSAVPVERLEVLANGVVVADMAVDSTANTVCLETEVRLPRGGWLAARCWGKGSKPCYFGPQPVYAHSSPIYVQVNEQPFPVDKTAVASFINHLDRTLEWVNHEGRYQNDAQRERLAGIFQAAREVLVKRIQS